MGSLGVENVSFTASPFHTVFVNTFLRKSDLPGGSRRLGRRPLWAYGKTTHWAPKWVFVWEGRTCSKGDPVQPQGEVTKVTHSQVFVKEPLGYEQKLYKGLPTRRRRCTLKMYTAADLGAAPMPPTPMEVDYLCLI